MILLVFEKDREISTLEIRTFEKEIRQYHYRVSQETYLIKLQVSYCFEDLANKVTLIVYKVTPEVFFLKIKGM